MENRKKFEVELPTGTFQTNNWHLAKLHSMYFGKPVKIKTIF